MKISDLFKSNLFPDFKLLAGRERIDNEICKVFILDSPDFCNWMRGGEFVIGNGYVFHNTPEQFPVFLEKLATNNAAALGMKFDRFRFAQNYDEIISLANKLMFPLIEIPFKYTWNIIYDLIYKHSRISPDRPSVSSSDLLTVIEERLDPLDLVYSLHDKIKREIYVYSKKMQLCHRIDDSAAISTDIAEQFRRCPVEERISPHNLGGIAINTQMKKFGGETVKFASYRICNIEICVRLMDRESVLSPECEKLVIDTLLLMYLIVMDEALVINSERQQVNSLLERILMGRYSDLVILMNQLRSLNCRFPMPCVLLFFYKADIVTIQRDIQQISSTYCLLGEQLALIVSPSEMEDKFDVISAITEKNRIFATYSETIFNMNDIVTTFSNIRESMTWIKRLNISCGFFSYTDVLVKICVFKFAAMDESRAIFKKYWQPLKQELKNRAVPLEKFVYSMIDNNFNLSQTAACLNIHYNTARNYVEEIEETLGMKLEDAESRFLLNLAGQIASAHQKMDGPVN